MNKLYFALGLIALCGCGETMHINYMDGLNGCEYAEVYRPKRAVWDFFGVRDSDLYVSYGGVECKTVINSEMKQGIHKTQYNNLPVIIEKIDNSGN
jgi:hypothetical protein